MVATGETYHVKEFIRQAFAAVDITDWECYVRQDPKFLRPAEVDLLVGDATKAEVKLGWKREVMFPELVQRMVAYDLKVESANR